MNTALSRAVSSLSLAALVAACGSTSGPSGSPPSSGSIQVFPTAGLTNWTEFTFIAKNVVDNDGDPVTYIWDFGDGTPSPPSAATVVKRFDAPGIRTVTLRVRDDDFSPIDSVQTSVTVRTLTGEWYGFLTRPPDAGVVVAGITLALTQTRESVAGTCRPVFADGPEGPFPFVNLRIEGQPDEGTVRLSGHCPTILVPYELEYSPDTDTLAAAAYGDNTGGRLRRSETQ